jgi:tRNA1(Val) A37 N6-methylase TrmN6
MQPQPTLDLLWTYSDLRTRTVEIRAKYLNEHDSVKKKALREELQKLHQEIETKTGIDPSVIENLMTASADIVVMNPPYVRQEAIPKEKKEHYVAKYGLDKKSDLYAYFLIRTLNLLSDKGVASVIASDKWLETSYGISL